MSYDDFEKTFIVIVITSAIIAFFVICYEFYTEEKCLFCGDPNKQQIFDDDFS